MSQAAIPSIWREELWHPMSVHLPIGILCVATIFELLRFVAGRHSEFLAAVSLALLFVGVPTAWASVYLGGIAEDVVNKLICDPTATHQHEDMAMLASYFFSAALTLKIALRFLGETVRVTILLPTLRLALITSPLLLMLTGSAYLFYAGHLGATLVYNQGAGVHKPDSQCKEFE